VLKALVVDDVKQNCRVMQGLLARYGNCDAANDGIQALNAIMDARLTRDPYQLLILDIMMPGMNGIQMLQLVRKMEALLGLDDSQRSRVFIVSAVGAGDYAGKIMQLRWDAWLGKPIFQNDLFQALRRCELI